jgi:hypothetical protein
MIGLEYFCFIILNFLARVLSIIIIIFIELIVVFINLNFWFFKSFGLIYLIELCIELVEFVLMLVYFNSYFIALVDYINFEIYFSTHLLIENFMRLFILIIIIIL